MRINDESFVVVDTGNGQRRAARVNVSEECVRTILHANSATELSVSWLDATIRQFLEELPVVPINTVIAVTPRREEALVASGQGK